MYRFGFDNYEDEEIKHPNLWSDDSSAFITHLPSSWHELLSRAEIPFETNSVELYNLNREKYIYIVEPLGDPYDWLGFDENLQRIDFFLKNISNLALDDIRNKRAKLLVWWGSEAHPLIVRDLNICQELHNEARRLGFDSSQITFVSSNMLMNDSYKSWKTNSDYRDDSDINIIQFLGYRESIKAFIKTNNWESSEPKTDKYDNSFLCFNRNLLNPHRTILLTMLQDNKLLENSLTSYQKIHDDDLSRIVTNGKYHFNISSITANKHQKILETLVADSPKVIDVDEWETNHFDTSTSWPYDKTFFSLVSETHFVWRCKFLSEKTFKAIYNHHPFILIGDCNSLELLRSYGFKTFEPFIDESYDKEVDNYSRMKLAIKEVKKLCSLDKNGRKEFLKNTLDIVLHNYQILVEDNSNRIAETFRKI